MAVLLVRHAMAVARRKWDGTDDSRPLTPRGVRQAELLPKALSNYELERVLSSAAIRCLETVRPLAEDRQLKIQEQEALREGSTSAALALVRKHGSIPSAMCSHGDVIAFLLDALHRDDGVDLGHKPRWAKGSTWVLEFDDGRCARATYVPAPA